MRSFEMALDIGGTSGLAFDSVRHPSCPEWTDAHVDAVLGEQISPLAWTLVGPAFERSQARLWAGLGVVPPTRDSRARFSARIDGRLHVGLSTLRTAALRIPGVDASRTETELGLEPTDAPRTLRHLAWHPLAIAGAMTSAGRAPLWVRRQRRLVARSAALPTSGLDTGALLERVERLRRQLVPVLRAHAFLRMGTHASLDRLRVDCGDDELAFGLLADLPDLEATQPSLALLAIADGARATGAVDELALDRFLDRFGHRGVDELDPTVPVWESQRDHVRAMIEGLLTAEVDDPRGRAADQRQRAETALASVTAVRRRRIATDARIARKLSVLGERSKSDVALHVNQLRRAITELGARHAHLFDPGDLPMLSWGELRTMATTGEAPDVDAAGRRHDLVTAAARPAPAARASRRLVGTAASPGRVEGTAVVVADPSEAVADGQVLVAHTTDTAWTPLFLGMVAVVTDTGGVLSHSSIVARDLGIPAVVGTGDATATITTGTRTIVDGDHGTVDLLVD